MVRLWHLSIFCDWTHYLLTSLWVWLFMLSSDSLYFYRKLTFVSTIPKNLTMTSIWMMCYSIKGPISLVCTNFLRLVKVNLLVMWTCALNHTCFIIYYNRLLDWFFAIKCEFFWSKSGREPNPLLHFENGFIVPHDKLYIPWNNIDACFINVVILTVRLSLSKIAQLIKCIAFKFYNFRILFVVVWGIHVSFKIGCCSTRYAVMIALLEQYTFLCFRTHSLIYYFVYLFTFYLIMCQNNGNKVLTNNILFFLEW